jgi:hypothetical protein
VRLAALVCALWGSALALTVQPTDAQRQQAIADGQALAQKRRGYPVGEYLLYSVADAYTLTPGEGSVEAVQLATPLERTRWGSYFLAIQGKAVTPQAVRQQAGLAPGHLAVVIYAHSPGGAASDQAFLQNFGPLRLTLAGQTLTPSAVARGDAALNNYRDEAGQVVFRWTSTLNATFDLSGLARANDARGTLRFTDATGKAFELPVQLGRYR